MSVYISTLLNHGTRYKAHFLYQVRNFSTGEVVKEFTPEIMDNSISLSDETVYTVLAGMKNVVENGSAAEVFIDYPIAIGGKTGTAQVKKTESDNAVFTAFAPFGSPEVAATCVIEHGSSGSMAGHAVRDTFTSYFKLDLNKDDDNKDEQKDEAAAPDAD